MRARHFNINKGLAHFGHVINSIVHFTDHTIIAAGYGHRSLVTLHFTNRIKLGYFVTFLDVPVMRKASNNKLMTSKEKSFLFRNIPLFDCHFSDSFSNIRKLERYFFSTDSCRDMEKSWDEKRQLSMAL